MHFRCANTVILKRGPGTLSVRPLNWLYILEKKYSTSKKPGKCEIRGNNSRWHACKIIYFEVTSWLIANLFSWSGARLLKAGAHCTDPTAIRCNRTRLLVELHAVVTSCVGLQSDVAARTLYTNPTATCKLMIVPASRNKMASITNKSLRVRRRLLLL